MNAENKTTKPNNKWLNIRKILSKCSERDLIGLISELYTLSHTNKDFLEARFIKNDTALSRYKALVKRYIAPNELQKISLKDARKAISDYKKATNDTIGLIDLMICYVEYGTDCSCQYGDMYDQYYRSLESVFSNVLKLMKNIEHDAASGFEQRLQIVVEKAECMGWGYYEAISDMLDDAVF